LLEFEFAAGSVYTYRCQVFSSIKALETLQALVMNLVFVVQKAALSFEGLPARGTSPMDRPCVNVEVPFNMENFI
jgi:hypothetical protein